MSFKVYRNVLSIHTQSQSDEGTAALPMCAIDLF